MEALLQERRVVIAAGIAFTLGATIAFAASLLITWARSPQPVPTAEKPISWEARQNLSRSRSWLFANARREGVVELPNGVQYRVLKSGTGNKLSANDTIAVRYLEAPLNEHAVVSGEARTLQLSVDKVLPGLRSVLLLMREGSEVEVFVPPDMAYATASRPGFPPGLAISYRLEILKINEK